MAPARTTSLGIWRRVAMVLAIWLVGACLSTLSFALIWGWEALPPAQAPLLRKVALTVALHFVDIYGLLALPLSLATLFGQTPPGLGAVLAWAFWPAIAFGLWFWLHRRQWRGLVLFGLVFLLASPFWRYVSQGLVGI